MTHDDPTKGAAPKQCKVALTGPDGDVETLWADPVGDGLYRLDNLPWYAYRVSAGDIVAAAPDASGQLVMTHMVTKSGNRTIRILGLTEPDTNDWTRDTEKAFQQLLDLGCTYEGATPRYVSVNIPPGVILSDVADRVTAAGLRFEYADPTYEDLFPDADDDGDPPDEKWRDTSEA